VRIESSLAGDATCPRCGSLLWPVQPSIAVQATLLRAALLARRAKVKRLLPWYMRHPIAVLTVGSICTHGILAGLILGVANVFAPITDWGSAGNFGYGFAIGLALIGSNTAIASVACNRWLP
jgi:hypothetical protein